MKKYQIKKAGIGKKVRMWEMNGRVFQHPIFGLSYIVETQPSRNLLGKFPTLIICYLWEGELYQYITYIGEDEETWAGEITTLDGKLVNKVKTEVFI